MKHAKTDNPTGTAAKTTSWQPRPAAAVAMQAISDTVATWVPPNEMSATPTSVEFPVLFGNCRLSVSQIELDTPEGWRLSERFEARTTLSYVLDDFSDDFFDRVNLIATTGAALRCPETGQAVVASGVSVFEGDEEALRNLYVPCLLTSSLAQSMPIQQALRDDFGTDFLGEKSEEFGLPGCEQPSRWRPDDFLRAAELMSNAGLLANASETGLTAEFPWQEGAVSAMFGHQTSLMLFDATPTHPSAGNGLHFRLVLPVSDNDEQLGSYARDLNQLEVLGVNVPPTFGAWAAHPEQNVLAYNGFWPNCMYRPGSVANIASWCRIRSTIVRQFIGNRS